MDLTADETAGLRRSVANARQEKSACEHVTLVDGPLNGLAVPLDAASERSGAMTWCIVQRHWPTLIEYQRRFDVWEFLGVRPLNGQPAVPHATGAQ